MPTASRYPLCLLLAFSICSCNSPADDEDAGGDAGALDAASTPCARDRDCEDGLFCTTSRCLPGDEEADARGCVVLTMGPCGEGVTCLEEEDRCQSGGCAISDADSDGHAAVACGGDDCDDFDPQRYPGNGEVCDLDGHDEDCDELTLGDTDADSDGFVSDACCNGGRCGVDCADTDSGRGPSSMESCNGLDDDCDGTVDEEGAESLCPGGACAAGRCDLGGWDRTFGGTALDLVLDVAMDSRGAIYVLGAFAGSGRFGSETFDSEGGLDAYVVSYDADGTYRWVRVFGNGDDAVESTSIAYDQASDQLYLVLRSAAPGALGNGVALETAGAKLVAMSVAGSITWTRQLLSGVAVSGSSQVAAYSGVTVSGSFASEQNHGGFIPVSPIGRDGFVACFDSSGEPVWRGVMRTGSVAGEVEPVAVVSLPQGVFVAGRFGGGSVDLGLGAQTPRDPNRDSGFVLALDASGAPQWDYVLSGTSNVVPNDIAVGTRLFVVGAHDGPHDFGDGEVLGAAGPGGNGFLAALELDGRLSRVRSWNWMGQSQASAVAVNAASEPIVVGGLQGLADFGTGTRSGPDDLGAFFVRYDANLEARIDGLFSYPGWPAVTCPVGLCRSIALSVAVGPADSTVMAGGFLGPVDFGSGLREPRGGAGPFAADGFALRLAN